MKIAPLMTVAMCGLYGCILVPPKKDAKPYDPQAMRLDSAQNVVNVRYVRTMNVMQGPRLTVAEVEHINKTMREADRWLNSLRP